MPYAVLEAGVAGLGTVASHVGGIPEIIEDGVSGYLINPGDVESITVALHKLIVHKGQSAQFGQALQKHVSKEFSAEAMMRATKACYLN
jgi:glycosyltransferase involved in cell wall biosynthesis